MSRYEIYCRHFSRVSMSSCDLVLWRVRWRWWARLMVLIYALPGSPVKCYMRDVKA